MRVKLSKADLKEARQLLKRLGQDVDAFNASQDPSTPYMCSGEQYDKILEIFVARFKMQSPGAWYGAMQMLALLYPFLGELDEDDMNELRKRFKDMKPRGKHIPPYGGKE